MILKILLVLAALLAVLLLVAAFRPDDFRISRSALISAAPVAITAQIDTPRDFQAWNPWAKLDPNIQLSYEGPASGVGAASSWNGDASVGAGRLTVIESRPGELVRLRLDFLKPFASTATAEFVLTPEEGQTRVTWSMYGKRNFLTKVIGLVCRMDKTMERSFDEGLANLKQRLQAPKA